MVEGDDRYRKILYNYITQELRGVILLSHQSNKKKKKLYGNFFQLELLYQKIFITKKIIFSLNEVTQENFI